jgi:DNA polymerase delta subunit 3
VPTQPVFSIFMLWLLKCLTLLPATVLAGDAEAGIKAMEADDGEASSEEDVADFARMRRCKAKKSTSRKRHIVFDEDEEMSENEEIDPEAVVNLASPEPSKVKTQARARETETVKPVQKSHVSVAPTDMEVDEAMPTTRAESPENLSCGQPDAIASTPEHSGLKRDGGASEPATETSEKASGPKRKKLLKTRIDERGREGT